MSDNPEDPSAIYCPKGHVIGRHKGCGIKQCNKDKTGRNLSESKAVISSPDGQRARILSKNFEALEHHAAKAEAAKAKIGDQIEKGMVDQRMMIHGEPISQWVDKKLISLLPKAVQVYEENLTNSSAKIAIMAADRIMSATGKAQKDQTPQLQALIVIGEGVTVPFLNRVNDSSPSIDLSTGQSESDPQCSQHIDASSVILSNDATEQSGEDTE